MRWLHFKVREEAGVNLFLVHSFEVNETPAVIAAVA
jgi:hypothetical protein